MSKRNDYVKANGNFARLIRAEILFMPILIFVPILVGIFLINDWYVRGFLLNNAQYNGEFLLGLILIIGNITFDIPFVKTMLRYRKK